MIKKYKKARIKVKIKNKIRIFRFFYLSLQNYCVCMWQIATPLSAKKSNHKLNTVK